MPGSWGVLRRGDRSTMRGWHSRLVPAAQQHVCSLLPPAALFPLPPLRPHPQLCALHLPLMPLSQMSTEACYRMFPLITHASTPLRVEDHEPAGLSAQRVGDAGPATGRRRWARSLEEQKPGLGLPWVALGQLGAVCDGGCRCLPAAGCWRSVPTWRPPANQLPLPSLPQAAGPRRCAGALQRAALPRHPPHRPAPGGE